MTVRRRAILAGAATLALIGGTFAYGSHSTPISNQVCQSRASGALPDPICTPGVVDLSITRASLCPHLSKAVVRSVSQATKDEVRRRYNDHNPGEIDHLISLELGGSNDIKNLWPEDGKIPNPKDAVENRLHAKVCAGTLTLGQAQTMIRTDWRSAR